MHLNDPGKPRSWEMARLTPPVHGHKLALVPIVKKAQPLRKLNQAVFAALVIGFATSFAHAQQPAASSSDVAPATPVMYVRPFQVVQESDGSGRLLSRTRATIHARSASQNAGALAQAIVQQLGNAGVTARYLAPGEPSPRVASGWLIGGVFYSRAPSGRIQSLLQGGSGDDSPNTEVSVTIADAAGDANVPFAVIGVADAIKAQGTVASWNPYVVAAKFVVKKAEGTTAVDSLAKDIANQIIGHLDALQQHAAAPPH
ncbi:hypothetical protein [Burkholderia sp. YIM B11467]